MNQIIYTIGRNDQRSYEHVIGTIREFSTPNFRVIVDAIEEGDLDLSWDDDGSTREGLQSGELVAFVARARVIHRPTGAELASDYLGGCIYKSLDDFADHVACARYNRELAAKGDKARCGSYFAGMVRDVCDEAREQLRKMRSVRVRG